MSITMDKYNHYAYIGVFKDKDYKHFSLIMDTNTAINLEKYYYKPNSMDERVLKSTRDFLIENIKLDPVYGFALQESCWDLSLKGINTLQYQKMSEALENQYTWSKERIILHSSTKGIKSKIEPHREKIIFIKTLTDNFDANPYLPGSYACVLKIIILLKKYMKNKIKLVEEYIHFINNELLGDCSLETQVLIYYLFGEPKLQEIGDKIFKLNKKKVPILLNSWNITWDFFFLRLLQLSYFDNDSTGVLSPKLVTADKGIINLANLCSLEGVISSSDGPMPIISFDMSNIRKEHVEFVEKINKELFFGAVERDIKRSKVQNMNQRLEMLIKNLETELLDIT